MYRTDKWYPCGNSDGTGNSSAISDNDTSILGYATIGHLTLGKE